jgi:predicted transcriptional regulator
MIARRPTNLLWACAGLALATTAAVAEQRLIIDMGAVKPPPPSSKVIHYQGTGSVRYSEQRSYQSAQERQSVRAAEERTEISPAQYRTTISAGDRRVVKDAQGRTYSEASARHGSVRLDTIR